MKHGTMSLRDRRRLGPLPCSRRRPCWRWPPRSSWGPGRCRGCCPPGPGHGVLCIPLPQGYGQVHSGGERPGPGPWGSCGWPGGGPIRPSAMSGGSIPIISICSAPTSPWGMWSCMRTVFSASRGASSGWRRERPTSGVWSCAGRPCHERAGQYTLAIRNKASYAVTGTVEYWETDDSPCH